MHDFSYPSYLRTHRKRWALTQPELGTLLGLSAGIISKYEKLARTPSVEAMIGVEFIFGVHARRIFPALHASVERKIAKNAVAFAEALGGLDDKKSLVKRQLFEDIAVRVVDERPHV